MAITKPIRAKGFTLLRRASPARHWRRAALVVVLAGLLLALAIGLFWAPLHERAVLATSYGARMACACHYVEGRDIKQCRGDFPEGGEMLMISNDPASRTITARMLPFTSTRASFHPGQGCVLEPWKR